jgi:uncharacterized protein (DUF433 family)
VGNVTGNQDVADWASLIDSSGSPAVIAGTSYPVIYVASRLRNAGLTLEQLQLTEFPGLTREQAEAAVSAVDAGIV